MNAERIALRDLCDRIDAILRDEDGDDSVTGARLAGGRNTGRILPQPEAAAEHRTERGKTAAGRDGRRQGTGTVSDEAYRKVLEAENALAQAIYLADHFAEKNGGSPAGEEFTGSYTMSAGLWNAVLREKQNLRHAIQTTFLPERKDA